MYTINASTKKIRKIKEFLKATNREYREAKLSDYLLMRDNPKKTLPPGLLAGVTVLQSKDWFKMIKEYGELSDFLESMKKKPLQPGQAVLITGGEYKDLKLKGIVKSVGNRVCGVETTIWGKLVMIHVGFDEMEAIKQESVC